MAQLLYVPIVHGVADMGSAAAGYRTTFIARFGEAKWRERCDQYAVIWRRIAAALDQAIDRQGVRLAQVRLYQDSLPVCGREVPLVTELAAQGSENHKLLLRLVGRGAVLMGTESPELLLQEYRLLAAPSQPESEAVLEQRDRFIAGRIAETLGGHEFGILFIGALHRVDRFIPASISLDYLRIAPS